MWIFWGQKTKVRRLEDGRSFRRECPECRRDARFVECVVEETLSAYSVIELATERETMFRCSECGELFRMEEPPACAPDRAAAPAAPAAPAARPTRTAEGARRERDARVEAELAALKKKLGRD